MKKNKQQKNSGTNFLQALYLLLCFPFLAKM